MAVNLLKVRQRVKELGERRYLARLPLGPVVVRPLDQPQASAFTLQPGDRWGERDTLYEASLNVSIPTGWAGETVALRLDLSKSADAFTINTIEGLLFVNGQPFHALDRYHREIILTTEQVARRQLEISVRLWTGIAEDSHIVERLELRRLDAVADALYSQLNLLLDALEHLPTTSPVYLTLSAGLDEVCNAFDFRQVNPTDFSASCVVATARLNERLTELETLFAQPATTDWQPRAIGIGHAHIDVAWLWQLRHTRLKAANTFSTALYHMDRYPYFRFIQSQPQLYQFVKEDQPALYERIKQKVAEGQWEAEGAMWVEADTNVTGAESLVRQFLFGQRFFQAEFGYRSRVLWLPDVFGYSPALPQLIKGAGADYFITSKLSWNDTNRMPADTFWWEGLDGTRVLTYFLTAQNDDVWPAYTYNGEMKPGVLARGWKNYLQKDLNHEILIAYGWGDGGGGPTREMVEAVSTLAEPLGPELPIAAPGRVADFMARLERQVGSDPRLPAWVGELYFEYHRGTYTSQGRNKRSNRRVEGTLHNVEWLSSLAQVLAGQSYPQEALNAVWRTILTLQFHDIIPGSSIGEVYSDAAHSYAEVEVVTDRLMTEATEAIGERLGLAEGSLVAFNSLGWSRSGLVELDTAIARRLDLPIQGLGNGRALVEITDVPALGYQACSATTPAATTNETWEISTTRLENDFWRLELNERGQLTSLFDKSVGREVLAAGSRANVFQMFEDKPLNFDAWDIDAFYEQKMWEMDDLVRAEVIERGPLRAGLLLEWQWAGRTRLTQKLYLYAHQPRIDFVTEVDWQERQTLLKVAFPTDLHAARATAEMQWGNLERPTHRNTSWDQARFETCAHKWFDLSEGDYGLAILNDCKYGYDVHDNTMRLTLLKGAIYPDPQADLGHHQFTYSLLPHRGGWYEGGVHRAAYELNFPLLTHTVLDAGRRTADLPLSLSLLEISVPNVVIETVKRAEDSDDLIVRVYECANRRGSFELGLPFGLAEAVEVNLLEEELPADQQQIELLADGHSLRSTIRPYGIKSFKLKPV